MKSALAIVASVSAWSFAIGQPVGEGGLLAFENAYVRPSHRAVDHTIMVSQETGRFTVTNSTLEDLIGWAFPAAASEIAGGPDWVYSLGFNIDAQSAVPFSEIPDRSADRLMLQGLLRDYFGLVVHRESRPLYILESSEQGPHLQEAESRSNSLQGVRVDGGQLVGRSVRVSALAEALGMDLSRPVLDRTRLAGDYDFALSWTPDTDDGPALIAALRDQLGLILRSVPVAVIVIDDVRELSEE